MKRRTMHVGFAAVSLIATLILASQWLQVRAGDALVDALDQLPQTLSALDPNITVNDASDYAEIDLAIANRLSASGNFKPAEAIYNRLIQQAKAAVISHSAQFNLANMYLRRALQPDAPALRTRPLLELAKQRYRDLLGVAPDHWDARYNLERALSLAPENATGDAHDKGDPVKSVRVIVPTFKIKDLP